MNLLDSQEGLFLCLFISIYHVLTCPGVQWIFLPSAPGLLAVPQTPGSAAREVQNSGLEQVGATRTGFEAQTRSWNYILAATAATIQAAVGSGPSGFGDHPRTLHLAVTEELPG